MNNKYNDEISLEDFIRRFIRPNSLVRLWLPLKGGGHQMLINKDESDVCMEHEILNDKTWQSEYKKYPVLGVTDIFVDGFYREAINIVIKNIDK